MSLPNLINMVNQPWVMEKAPLESLLNVFDMKLSNAVEYEALVGMTQSNLFSKNNSSRWEQDTALVGNKKVSYLKIDGTLVPRTGSMSPYCGMTPVIGATAIIKELAMTSDQLILHFDSPGGVVTAIPELASVIRELDVETIAFTDTMMCSGAYWLASACNQIVASPSALVGSIGAYIAITKENTVDSKSKTHIFHAGNQKIYGSPSLELTDAESAHFQASVDATRAWFVADVALGRKQDASVFEKTEAGVFKAKDVKGTLVDHIMTFDEMIEDLNS